MRCSCSGRLRRPPPEQRRNDQHMDYPSTKVRKLVDTTDPFSLLTPFPLANVRAGGQKLPLYAS